MAGNHRNPDRPPDTTRRRFLAVLGSVFGLGVIARLFGWLGGGEAGPTSTTAISSPAATSSVTSASSAAVASSEVSTTSSDAATTTSEEATTTTDPTATSSEATTTTEAEATSTTEQATTTSTQPGTTVTSLPESGSGLLLLERAAWGAAASEPGFEEHAVDRITVHHTAAALVDNAKAPSRIRRHQSYHLSLGWPDLAYHVMIDRAGNLYEGRPMEFRGDTATSYDPSGHFLPCLEGNYNSETPTEVQMEALAQVCAWAAERWGFEPTLIGGHRDFAATSCPGDQLYDDISSGALAGRVSEILASGAPSLDYLRGQAAADVVAAIEAGG